MSLQSAQPDYAWLLKEGSPKMLVEALKLYGITEIPGKKSTQSIIDWAKEVGTAQTYTNDDIPWCGLFMWVVAKRAGYQAPAMVKGLGPLWADAWVRFGAAVTKPSLGDVLCLGGHVGMYVGEDASSFHVLGGNQSNAVNIRRFPKTRLLKAGARRPVFKIGQPANVRPITLSTKGVIAGSIR